ncbi:MAG: glycosyltransferase [Nitrospiraceae bacterium]|nr:glycosyltransferase [Nitrospiraceae bacterium]
MRISATLIVRNEERCLARCLESLRGVVDEIVIVDTGSGDATVSIAKAFTDQVHVFTWIDDFAAARNYALDQTHGNYVLAIDADESIVNTAAARGLLEAFAARHGESVVGAIRLTSTMGSGGAAQQAVSMLPRFFKRGAFRYAGAIHEQLVAVDGEKTVAETGLLFDHTGYAQAPSDPGHKSRRNIPILRAELARRPDDEYFQYQLGKAHYALEEYADAAAAFAGALACIRYAPDGTPTGRLGSLTQDVYVDLVVSLAYAWANTNDFRRALDHLAAHKDRAALRCCPDFHYVLGYVHLMLGAVRESRAAFETALRAGGKDEHVIGTGSFMALYQLGLLCEAERDLDGAAQRYLESLVANPRYHPAIARSIDCAVENRRPLPRGLWDACDRDSFAEAYAGKLRAALGRSDHVCAALLLESARLLSPDLYAHLLTAR